jgi:protein TonB
MKNIFLLSVFIFPFSLFGQIIMENYYCDYDFTKCDSNSAKYICYCQYLDSTKVSGVIRITTLQGDPVSECGYSNINSKELNGPSRYYRENGQLKSLAVYKNNLLNGELKSYYPNGRLKRQDYYSNGVLIEGHCYTSTGADTLHFDYNYITMPEYPGGDMALYYFIQANTNYPNEAKKKKISGRVFVTFVIDIDGSIKDPRVKESIDPLLDEEAIRVINLMKPWTPGQRDGEQCKVTYTLPVNFKL